MTLLTPDQMAEQLGHSSIYWTREARAKRVPHRRIGRSIRFAEEDVAAIVAAALVEPSRPARDDEPAPSMAADIAPGSAARRASRLR